MSDPTPILTDASDIRTRIRDKAVAAVQAAFPLEMKERRLEIEDVHVLPQRYSPDRENRAILTDGTLSETLKGTLVLKDREGKVVDRAKNFTIVHLPYLTDRHTVIANGNEYQVANQLRRKPGVYTARADNGELRAIFNLGRGKNFDLGFEPNKGTFHLAYGTSNVPLYPVLRALGVSHQELADQWGKGVADANAALHGKHEEKAVAALYAKVEHPAMVNAALPHAAKVEALKKKYEQTTLDPHVTQATLGHAWDRVTPHALIGAAKKVLAVHNDKAQVDDTDALTFKTFHSLDDFIAERLRLSARAWAPKAKMSLNGKTNIRETLRPAPFSDALRKFITTSSLSAVPTGINPLELLDHAVKVTSLGEGGIPSDRAIPLDARMIHNTHIGALDPIRTPECFAADAEVLTRDGWKRWDAVSDGDLFTCRVDGLIQHLPAERVVREPYKGPLYCMTTHLYGVRTATLAYRVTPNHRVFCSPDGVAWGFRRADEVHGTWQSFETDYALHADPDFPVHPHGKSNPNEYRAAPDCYSIEPYDGAVYCATVPGGMLYVRQPGHIGHWTGNSNHSGVDIRATLAAHRDKEGNLYTVARNVKTGKEEFLRSGELGKHVLAFAGEDLRGTVDAFVKGRVAQVSGDKVTHQLLHTAHTYSPATTLIPMIHSIQGNRAIMGSKMGTQALPLLEREAPFVQVRSHLPGGESFETLYGHMFVPRATVSGTVKKIEDGWIYIKPSMVKTEKRAAVEVDRKAVLITGNPKFIQNNPAADDFYHQIENHLGSLGYDVTRDAGEPHTSPPPADLYVTHSRGADRLRFVAPSARSVMFGSHREGAINHPEDRPKEGLLHETPHPSHYVFTNEMRAALDRAGSETDGDAKLAAAAKDDEDLVKVPYQTLFPFPSKTYLHHDLSVKPGDKVVEGQRMGESNYTRKGTLALGKNLLVAYMPYYGLNSNDAVVISEGCSKKLTSEHMYREVYPLNPQIELSREKHRMYFGTKYSREQYAVLDESGVVKKGSRVNPKDLLVTGLTKTQIIGTDLLLGRISKSLAKPYQEVVLQWTHGTPGEVVEVVRTATQIAILVRTHEKMQVGDKLAGRYGNKGVVAKILPDHEMIQDAKGRPIDLLLTSAGVVSRINPAQVIETAVGKVVEKTGKPIVFDNNSRVNAVDWAKKLLREHGISDKEHVYDPLQKRRIEGPDGKGVLVGRQFIYKLFKSTDTNFAAHGVGPYDLNEQPLKTGGDDSAKGLGKMEFDALIAHNARNFLREAATVKGQKNDEFWKALQLGMPLPAPKSPFAFQKFVGMLEGAGLRVDKRGSKIKLLPMTDKDVLARSRGAIENPKTLIAKNLKPEAGGLFDPRLTGGPQGTLYAHIDLHEPIPSPVFQEPVRRLLGLTGKEFDKHMAEKGGRWFHDQLRQIDVPSRLKSLQAEMARAKGAELNDVVKQIKYLKALQAENMKPHEAYMISKVPVVPPIFRPILPQPGDTSQLMIADANKLYGHLLDSNHTLKTTAVESDRGKHRQQVYNAVAALYGTEDVANDELRGQSVKGFLSNIAGVGTPKGGFFQRKLMRRTQDVSGRGTAVPDANLGMDHVGLPEPMLWGMYDKMIVARLVRQGYGALEARERVNKRDAVAREAMLQETRERPVLINRAPTLHRWSIVAAYPVPVQGKTIRVNPFIEKGMNLDYDGDTLQVHAPITQDAIDDTRKMTLSQMLLADQTHASLMAFPQHEAIIGFTHASKAAPKGQARVFDTHEDAIRAWRKGEIKITDPVSLRAGAKTAEANAPDENLARLLSFLASHPTDD